MTCHSNLNDNGSGCSCISLKLPNGGRKKKREKGEHVAKTVYYKSADVYDKAMAHIHIHHENVRHIAGNYPHVVIAGKPHHVEHGR